MHLTANVKNASCIHTGTYQLFKLKRDHFYILTEIRSRG